MAENSEVGKGAFALLVERRPCERSLALLYQSLSFFFFLPSLSLSFLHVLRMCVCVFMYTNDFVSLLFFSVLLESLLIVVTRCDCTGLEV